MGSSKQWAQRRAATRLATAGLAGVLVLLTGFALWAAFSTDRATRQANRLSSLSDAYQQARFAVAAEESLGRKYRLEPGPEVRAGYRQATGSLLAALEVVRQRGDGPGPDPGGAGGGRACPLPGRHRAAVRRRGRR